MGEKDIDIANVVKQSIFCRFMDGRAPLAVTGTGCIGPTKR